jgi:hypothetical protein
MTERSEPTGESQPLSQLEHPFIKTVEEDARSTFSSSEDFAAFKRGLSEINRQAVDSFSVWHSKEYPDTSFSTICVTPNEQMVREVQGKTTAVQEVHADEDPQERIFFFLQPHFHSGRRAGGPFSTLDAVSDRTFRELPKVALKTKSPKAKIKVIADGSPIGFAARAGEKFTQDAGREGFDAYGKLYAEHILSVVGDIDENTKVVIQGFSRGAVTGERTYHFLIQKLMEKHAQELGKQGKVYDEDEKEKYRVFLYQHIQGLYDEPAGAHRKTPWMFLKAANFIGLPIEDIKRRNFSKEKFLSPEFDANENEFLNHFSKDIPDYTPEELARIKRVVGSEYKHLALGTPPDREEPGFYRAPLFDPTNTRIPQVAQELLGLAPEREGFSKGLWSSEGRKKFAVIKRLGHYHVPWRDSYKRWEKNIAAVRRWTSNTP